jgi:transposase
MQNQLESLLEEAHIKLSGFVTDLLGVSARRMLQALAGPETDPAALAVLADKRLRATPAQLCDALGACTELNPVYRRLITMALAELQFLEQQIVQLDREIAHLLHPHEDAAKRLAGCPAWEWIRHSRSLPKSGPQSPPFLPTSTYVPGWQYAQGTTRAGE